MWRTGCVRKEPVNVAWSLGYKLSLIRRIAIFKHLFLKAQSSIQKTIKPILRGRGRGDRITISTNVKQYLSDIHVYTDADTHTHRHTHTHTHIMHIIMNIMHVCSFASVNTVTVT